MGGGIEGGWGGGGEGGGEGYEEPPGEREKKKNIR
jgi:hypothetical protein